MLAAVSSPATVAAVEVPTVYDNHQMYPIGSRAAGMAGAYTALACDEAALHYNPAALGCAGASRLELAANAYLLEGFSTPDAFGAGNDISTVNFHSIPSIAGAARILHDGNEDGSNRWAAGFNVTLPHSLVLTVDPAQPERASFLSANVVDNVIALDVGVGWQIDRVVSVGLSLGGGLRVFNAQTMLLPKAPRTSIPCGDAELCTPFLTETNDLEAIALGLRGKAGVRFVPTEGLSIGLAVSSPSIDIYGSSKTFATTTFFAEDDMGLTAGDAVPFRFEGTSRLSLPLRIALGIAYTTGPLTLSLDGSVNFPHAIGTIADLEQIVVQGEVEIPAEFVPLFETIHDRTSQPNANLGAEIVVSCASATYIPPPSRSRNRAF